MNGAEHRIGLKACLHMVGDRTHFLSVRPHDAHLHRPAGRGPKEQAVDLAADRGEIFRKDRPQLDDQPFAGRFVLSHDKELGEVRIAQLLVERQEEARRAFADIGGDELLVGIIHHLRFQRLGLNLDLLDAGAFGQPEIDEDFRPRGLREEILRDELESPEAGDEGAERQKQHDDPMANRPADRAAQPAIEPRVEGVVMLAGVMALLEDHVAEPRREIDRDEPRSHQRDAHDIKQRTYVFTGRRGGETDGMKPAVVISVPVSIGKAVEE